MRLLQYPTHVRRCPRSLLVSPWSWHQRRKSRSLPNEGETDAEPPKAARESTPRGVISSTLFGHSASAARGRTAPKDNAVEFVLRSNTHPTLSVQTPLRPQWSVSASDIRPNVVPQSWLRYLRTHTFSAISHLRTHTDAQTAIIELTSGPIDWLCGTKE